MTAWVLQIDPPTVTTGRTMLDLNSGQISLGTLDGGGSPAIDWGAATITAYETQQGQFGNNLISWVLPNRTITISLILGGTGYEDDEETARSQLQQKVARLQAEGGVLMRQRGDGPAMYADIVNATLTLPDQWGETGDVEPNVQLVLETLPDFYGDEIQLDTIYATGVTSAQLTLSGTPATIEGDYPARCRLVVTDTSAYDQHAMLWALQSKHASTATSAALAIPAMNMTLLNGATTVTSTGGTDLNSHVVQYGTAGSNVWSPFLMTTLASGSVPLSHQGTFRVWARVAAALELRLVWAQGSLSVPVTNDSVSPVFWSSTWGLVDLGVVRVQPTSDGSATEWFGVVQHLDQGISGENVYVDELYFQPVDESAGQLSSVMVPSPASITSTGMGTAGANGGIGGFEWNFPVGPATVSSTLSVGVTTLSDQANITGFGFNIPTSATVVGVTAYVSTWCPDTSGASYVRDNSIRLLIAGTAVGSNLSAGRQWSPAAPATGSYGGAANMWGTTLTPAQVNASNFGLGVQAAATAVDILVLDGGGSGPNPEWGEIFQVDLEVTYTLATGLTVTQDAVVYAGQTAQLSSVSPGITRYNSAGTVDGPVSVVLGDLPRIPPSGLEDRPATLFVRPSRGDLNTLPDTAADTFTVTPYYRPTYLSRA